MTLYTSLIQVGLSRRTRNRGSGGLNGRPALPFLSVTDAQFYWCVPTVCQLLDKFGQKTLEVLRVSNDKLNDVMQRIRALCFCEQFGAVSFRLFKDCDLEHHVAAQFGSHQLKAVVFLNHTITISLRQRLSELSTHRQKPSFSRPAIFSIALIG